jgi:mono/diheme cytochrome c family protein
MHRISVLFISGVALTVAMLCAFTAHAQTRGAAPAARGAAPAARTIKNPVASTQASITAGAAAYKKYCAFCHGVTGKGDGPLAPKDSDPADLTDAMWTHGSTDGEIFTVIANGGGPNSKMIGFKGKMPDQDMWHIVNFVRSIGPKDAKR